jgi:hypothetical protein
MGEMKKLVNWDFRDEKINSDGIAKSLPVIFS